MNSIKITLILHDLKNGKFTQRAFNGWMNSDSRVTYVDNLEITEATVGTSITFTLATLYSDFTDDGETFTFTLNKDCDWNLS